MTHQKLSQNLASINKISRLSVSGFLVRVLIYSSVLFSLRSAYNFDLDGFHLEGFLVEISNTYPKAEQDIIDINNKQREYYIDKENYKFIDYPELFKGMSLKTDKYNYRILSSMGPVQSSHNEREPAQFKSTITIAEAKNTDDKSYIGVVFAFIHKTNFDKDLDCVTTTDGICETARGVSLPSTLPTFDKNTDTVICPLATTLVSR